LRPSWPPPGLTSASATSSAEGLQLDGTWMVTVTRINPPPGLAPTFKSLLSYVRGGVMIETKQYLRGSPPQPRARTVGADRQ
jgi:hypothetical protein